MFHHAYLLIGSREWGLSYLQKSLKKVDKNKRLLEYEDMKIGHARELIKDAHLKATDGGEQFFVLVARNILREAQNALLKLFEDPSPTTTFYLILPNEEVLLPTLRSRLHVLEREGVSYQKSEFNSFLGLSPSERLKKIELKLKEEDKEWIKNIVSGIEQHAHDSQDPRIIRDALVLSRYINTKGASKKMLLEHVTLSL
jgi:hypothetical protein